MTARVNQNEKAATGRLPATARNNHERLDASL